MKQPGKFELSLKESATISVFMEKLGAATGSRYQIVSRRDDVRHFASAVGLTGPGFGMSQISCEDGLRATISASLIGTDEVRIYLPAAGSRIGINQFKNESVCRFGEAVVSVSAEASSILYGAYQEDARSKMTRIAISRDLLKDYVSSSDLLVGGFIGKANGYLGLFTSYVQSAMREADALDAAGMNVVSRHLVELAALAVGANMRGKEAARSGALGKARVAAAKAFILRNLTNPALGEDAVAQHVHISRTQIRRDFELDGEPIAGFIRRKRLEEALRQLTESPGINQKVIDIAFQCGFDDVTTFNRAFRRQFGVTPTEARFCGNLLPA
jgi:AraC-like DNA-binding protein